jgi:hypothetical protein
MPKKGGKHGGHRATLDLVAYGEIPLREVSGLAVAQLQGVSHLAAVGDHGPRVGLARLDPSNASGLGDWTVIDLSTLDAPPGAPVFAQAEAVATDGNRQALVLIEDPALLLVLDTVDRRLTSAYSLDSGEHSGLEDTWRNDASSRGEGMVLMRGGHVLVIKEKRPAGLIEFGPEGDEPVGVAGHTLLPPGESWIAPPGERLMGLAWWPVDDTLADLSDADIGPDGALYLLSDKENAIARLAMPVDVDGTVSYERVWALPDDIEKAEGLAFLPDGSALVAVDRSDVGRNLFTLPPLSLWP